VLSEHVRLGSSAVILSRTFHRSDSSTSFEDEVASLREAEQRLATRSPAQRDADHQRVLARIDAIAAGMAPARAVAS